MPFWRTYYHLIWCTQNRQPLITPELEPHLFAYLVRHSAEQGAYVYEINGWNDHVHMVVSIPPKLAVADFVKQIKGASSHDLKLAGYPLVWQRGYGVLTVGERQRPIAEAYVRGQKTHHQQQTTNAWLERTAEADEGPADRPEKVEENSSVLREQSAPYLLDEELPF